jgi:predicted dehydrogenase
MERTARLRGAVIGVGKADERTWAKGGGHKIGYDHARAMRSIGIELSSAADIDPVNLGAFQSEFNLSSGFADYREMLAAEQPDVVGICTYVGLHAEMVQACALAGVSVIVCEKPFVSSPAQLDSVRRTVEETGVTLGIAHIRRFSPCFVKARDLIREGAVGQPVLLCGGLGGWDLSEFGSHWIDLIRFLRDDRPVEYVMGQARVRDGFGYGHRMEEHALAYFEFDDACRGLVDGGRSFAGPSGWDIRVVGTEGVLAITENVQVELFNGEGRQVVPTPPADNVWEDLYGSLVRERQGGPESPVSFRRCAPSAEINLGAYLSAVKGDRVDLPLAGEDLSYDRWPLDELAERNHA